MEGPDPLAEEIRTRLTSRQPVSDEQFDQLLPVRPRIRSASYWSSVEVAQTASRWLTEAGAQRVLDVGSGVGKFCSIAALSSSRRVWGVELRPDLALAARQLAQRLGAEVVILDGTLESVDPGRFDAFYFFNPFAEHLAEVHERYDERFPASVDGFINDVRIVERWLRAAPIGTAMVSYNGLGGRIPLSWVVEKSDLVNGDHLRLWVKRGLDDSNDAIIEVNEYLLPASRLASLIHGGDPRVKGNSLVARLVSPGSS
ncbi:MAG: class I SAM-dependent methyltransferase [Archangium sp.]|nr:class I SAM-dependent methyltransferase [Archangium sp.]